MKNQPTLLSSTKNKKRSPLKGTAKRDTIYPLKIFWETDCDFNPCADQGSLGLDGNRASNNLALLNKEQDVIPLELKQQKENTLLQQIK